MTKVTQDAAARQVTASTSSSPAECSLAFSARLSAGQINVASVVIEQQPPLPADVDAIVTVLVSVAMSVSPAAIASVLRALADRFEGPPAAEAERAPRGEA